MLALELQFAQIVLIKLRCEGSPPITHRALIAVAKLLLSFRRLRLRCKQLSEMERSFGHRIEMRIGIVIIELETGGI